MSSTINKEDNCACQHLFQDDVIDRLIDNIGPDELLGYIRNRILEMERFQSRTTDNENQLELFTEDSEGKS